jgi:hypothetical protein
MAVRDKDREQAGLYDVLVATDQSQSDGGQDAATPSPSNN